MSIFFNKRSKIKDNRDDRIVKKESKRSNRTWHQTGFKIGSSAYYKRGLSVDRYPEGYPRISAYIDSDYDTALFRRFGTLHARSLLYKQVELTELEAQLDELDKEDAGQLDKEDEGNTGAGNNKWRLGHSISLAGGKENEKRRDLMKKIDEKMEEYGVLSSSIPGVPFLTRADKLVLREAALRKLSRPSKRVYRNFMDFMYTEHPFSDSDERFVYHEQDFVSLGEYEGDWLDELMHRLVNNRVLRVRYLVFFESIAVAKLTPELLRPSSSLRTSKLRLETPMSATIRQTALTS
jgi:hypothetical protein